MATGDIAAIARTAAVEARYKDLKPEQLQAIVEFVRGCDVFVSLPTGYGKSLIYGLLPIVVERLRRRPNKTTMALVISPLSALMPDQKSRFIPKGISAEFLGELQDDELAIRRVTVSS